jgi:hypothetical protein
VSLCVFVRRFWITSGPFTISAVDGSGAHLIIQGSVISSTTAKKCPSQVLLSLRRQRGSPLQRIGSLFRNWARSPYQQLLDSLAELSCNLCRNSSTTVRLSLVASVVSSTIAGLSSTVTVTVSSSSAGGFFRGSICLFDNLRGSPS